MSTTRSRLLFLKNTLAGFPLDWKESSSCGPDWGVYQKNVFFFSRRQVPFAFGNLGGHQQQLHDGDTGLGESC